MRGSLKGNQQHFMEYFTIKMSLSVPQESQKPFSLLLSIPATYTVREAILHSLEYFNGKMKRFRLKMSADCYQLIEEAGVPSATLAPITEDGSSPQTPSKKRGITANSFAPEPECI